MVTVRAFDKWLRIEGIQSIDIAKVLGVTPSALSRWRERKTIPRKHQSALRKILGLPQASVQRFLRRQVSEFFQ